MLSFLISVFGVVTDFYPHLTYRSFSIENNEVVWVQVFTHDSIHHFKPEAVLEFVKGHPWLANARVDDDEIVADLHDFRVDFKKYNARFIKTSTLIRTGRWDGKVRISFRDGKYRVKVYGLHYVALEPERTAGKLSFEAHQISGTLSQCALHDHRRSFKKSTFFNLDLLHMGLREIFTLNTFESNEENW
jgi:hypothetical protein